MATTTDLLLDAFNRIQETVHEAVDGLRDDELAVRLDPEANSVGWLVWHLSRVQDDHVAGLAGTEQVWTRDGWAERFALPFDTAAIGYGQSAEEVAQVRDLGPQQLSGYYDAVHAASVDYLRGLGDSDLDRVVDEAWDPPVTVAVRLISVVSDDLQHAGQAALLRGVMVRRR